MKLSLELEINDSVEFLGWVPQDRVYDLINRATIVVIPSNDTGGETLPTVSIQASQMERPIIASNISGIPEIITHKKTGFLFEQNNHVELSKTIDFLLNNPSEAIKIGQQARENALKKFSIDNYVSSYDKLYRKYIRKVS